MAESELLAAIADMLDERLKPVTQKLTGMENRMTGLETKMTGMEDRMTGIEDRMTGIEGTVTGLEEKMSAVQKITADTREELTQVKLHIENVTDKNITLLAENYCNLVKKLDENNKITDVQLAYQIKVNYLMEDMEKMKKEIAELKSRIA